MKNSDIVTPKTDSVTDYSEASVPNNLAGHNIGGGVLSKHLIKNVHELGRDFQSAEPFKHVLIAPFFDEEMCNALIREFPVPDEDRMVNEFGEKNRKFARHDVREIGPSYQRLDDFVRSSQFQKTMEALTGIPDLLYDPEYHGAGTHDNHSGQGMDAHIDFNLHRTTGYHRRVNAIIYLNEEWDEDWGGCLELHKDPWNPVSDSVKSFPPLKNHCVLFETNEYSWHGFKRVKPPSDKPLSRKSFTIYMYTRERPANEVAEKHGTIYVQDGMPSHFKPGHTLTSDDVADLVANFRKRNEYLKGLYQREKNFQTTINNLGAFTKAFRLPILGYCRQSKTPEGVYPGLGVTPAMSAQWAAAGPIRRIIIKGSLPKFIEQNRLRVQLDTKEQIEMSVNEKFELSIDVNYKAGDTINLTVLAELSRSPKDAGTGTDARPFSWHLREIEFAPSGT